MPYLRALTRYAAAGIEGTGLGFSDFGVLEVLLHKGPSPVNTIGPIVDLTPGSISIAVDRLVEKGLVSRVESAEDRGARIVALSARARTSLLQPFELTHISAPDGAWSFDRREPKTSASR